nr:hypothetical protein [uncultured Ruminococcus sp.]
MMKQKYTQAELEILSFDDEDIIVTSPGDPNETPKWPIGGTSGTRGGADPFYNI